MGIREIVEPVFLLSLPRSGSTLLQRVLASHHDVATTSEPWLLLPLIYSFRDKGIEAEYEQHNLAHAMEDFCLQLPNGKNDCLVEMRELVLNLYKKIGGDAAYFIDKTPRYHLIVDELMEMFPNCKIILLWRNPLAVAASMMETWGKGKWNLYSFHVDLYKGLDNLVNVYEKHPEKILAVKFEDFVSDSESYSQELFEYLDLPVNASASAQFSKIDLKGRMGDPTGVKQYKSINDESLNKWKKTLANPVRKIWARRYLKWLGEKRLAVMGYSKEELIRELNAEPYLFKNIISDVLRIVYNPLNRFLKRRKF